MRKKLMSITMSAALSMGTLLFGMQTAGMPFQPEIVWAEEAEEYTEETQYYEDALPRVWDEADLLTDEEEAALLSRFDEISDTHACDVAVATVTTTEGMDMQTFTDEFFMMNGYGVGENRDGILLMINMESRNWYISTTGFGITAITDAGLEYISEAFLPELSDGNYKEAFTIYADLCDDFLTQAETGEPYDVDNMPYEPLSLLWLPISILISMIIAAISTAVMKSSLKSVRSKNEASDYTKEGSMKVENARDIFLYREIRRDKKAEEKPAGGSSTHTDSSGTKHGGGGGSF